MLHDKAKSLLKQFCQAYEARDLDQALALFSENMTCWGSGLDEVRVGRSEMIEQLKRDWSQSEKGSIVIQSFFEAPVSAPYAAATCLAKVVIDGCEHVLSDLRGTITLVEEAGDWKIGHMHCSFPDFRNPEENSFPVG